MIINRANEVLHRACGEYGIYATADAQSKDNYRSVWSRDACIAGIVGTLRQEEYMPQALLTSLKTLARHQHSLGMIPSNVGEDSVSYGSLVGRVDATTWFLCGVGIYLSLHPDEALRNFFHPTVEKAMHVLDVWEFNAKDLVYTPMSGNWADEYVTQAYTLYDQCLRLWGLALLSRIWQHSDWRNKAINIRGKLRTHYQFVEGFKTAQHPRAYPTLKGLPYWASSFGAFGYDIRFDMAANGLASLLGIDTTKDEELTNYLHTWAAKEKSYLLPVFSPVITHQDLDWKYLEFNNSFSFKNVPHHFHNGGVWPIFLSLLASGLMARGHCKFGEAVWQALSTAIEQDNFQFHEYFAGDTKKVGGVKYLCFSAAGILLLDFFRSKKYTSVKPIWDLSYLLYEE